MKLVFYSVVLNHHQAPVADEIYKLLGDEYCFVELINLGDSKGTTDDYSKRPYLLMAWESQKSYDKAMELARMAECCVFSGVQSLPYMTERLKLGLLSFDMGERWLKQGLKNVLSPAISKMALAYYLNGWKHKPLYKLCMSAFAADDHARLGMYKGKCYKWGYFTQVRDLSYEKQNENLCETNEVRLMWCARFIYWKHPELAIQLAKRLKDNGYKFHLAMYGDGPLRKPMEKQMNDQNLRDCVHFTGNVPNYIVHQTMRESDIFLFTSDREEGWGAVANESMSEGCLLIGSDEIGAVPYLVKDGKNGLIYKSDDFGSLYKKIIWAIEHPAERQAMCAEAVKSMRDVWSPQNAARSLLKLIDNLKQGSETSFVEGPCSKA